MMFLRIKACSALALALCLVPVPVRGQGLPTPGVDTEPGASGFVYVGTINPTGLPLSGFPPIDLGTVTINRVDAQDGSAKHVDLHGGTSQVEHFGIGFAQSFAGIAQITGSLDATIGEIRLFAADLATVEPLYYDTFPGATARNPFYAQGSIGLSGSFIDVVTIPATKAAPHRGDPDTIRLGVFVFCTSHDTPGLAGIRSHATAALVSSSGRTLGDVLVDNPPAFSPGDDGCPFGTGGPLVSVPVETPLALRFSVSTAIGLAAGYDLPQGNQPGGDAVIDALHTAIATISNSDGVGAIGSLGRDYSYAAYVATHGSTTSTTTTTTTTTSYTPPSTLPGCAGYCGDGTVQPDCAEACECPMGTGMQIVTICDAATSIPALAPGCARCAGCQIDSSRCADPTTTTTEPVTTTTTTIATGPVTTTTAPGTTPTTTTTLPPGCALESTFESVECRVGAVHTVVTDTPGSYRQRKKLLALLSMVETKVQAAAAERKPRKRTRLVSAAATNLATIQRLATKPSVPAAVRTEVDTVVSPLITDVRGLRS